MASNKDGISYTINIVMDKFKEAPYGPGEGVTELE